MRQGDCDLRIAGSLRRLAVKPKPGRLTAHDLDLPGRHSPAKGLDHGLLGREASRQVTTGTRALAGVGQLGWGEEPVRQPRAALQRALHPLDLDQVDADRKGHGAYLRPTTALNSAWSPFVPEPVTT
jgi:hypothetical protein